MSDKSNNVKWVEEQIRVWQWQKDMLQPVAEIGHFPTGLPEFYKAQLSFLAEEAGHELAGAILAGDRTDMADALADSLFTALGLLNVIGCPCANVKAPSFEHISEMSTIQIILEKLDTAVLPQDVLNYVSDLVSCLESLSAVENIPLKECFDEVCRSNDTKFWTTEQVNESKDLPEYDGWSMTRTTYNGWVVKDPNGKVKKPKTFSPPDFSKIVSVNH